MGVVGDWRQKTSARARVSIPIARAMPLPMINVGEKRRRMTVRLNAIRRNFSIFTSASSLIVKLQKKFNPSLVDLNSFE